MYNGNRLTILHGIKILMIFHLYRDVHKAYTGDLLGKRHQPVEK